MSTETTPESSESHKQGVSKRLKAWVRRKMNREIGEEIQTILEEREEADQALSEGEKELIVSALRFKENVAEDVAVPRGEVVYLSQDDSFETIVEKFKESGFSRMPVCAENLDEVVGFVTLKDLVKRIGQEEGFDLKKLMRPCTFVPETLPIPAVLTEMRANRVQMVVMVDEYGGTAGLITLKDLLEELVGDIEDENEQILPRMVIPMAGGRYRFDPRVPINDLDDALKEKLGVDAEADYDTVGGLALHVAGRVPEKGDRFTLSTDHILVVNDADGRRITRLTLLPKKKEK